MGTSVASQSDCLSPNGSAVRALSVLTETEPHRSPPTCHSRMVDETKTYAVSLVSNDASVGVDEFFKYLSERLPEEGEIIDVVRFLRGRVVRARVTRVDANLTPPIAATQID